MREDKRVYARTVKKKPESKAVIYSDHLEDFKHKAALAKLEQRSKLISIGDKIAESTFWYRNWKWPCSNDFYPNQPDMRTVDKCYPHAKGGTLLVDEPLTEADAALCFEKQKVLKKLGFRYIVIETLPHPTSFMDALEQLGEI